MKKTSWLIRFVLSRLIQIFGNILKAGFYVQFWLMPYTRFTLPSRSSALFRSSSIRQIPKIFWQTNFTDKVTFPVYFNYLWNRLLSPTFEFRFFTDDDCIEFIRKNFPSSILDAYLSLQIGAARADYWRVLVLLKEGGVYIDIDGALCWPLEMLLSKSQTELLIKKREGVTNYFLGFAPNHPVLQKIADQILANIQENILTSVFDLTGPTVLRGIDNLESLTLEDARLVCRQGQFTSKIFQYVDKPRGHWGDEQADKQIIK